MDKQDNTAARNMRRLAHFRRLHLEPRCRVCGETELCLLQIHHRYGKNHSDELEVQCVKCHALIEEYGREEGVWKRVEHNPVKRVAAMLEIDAVRCEQDAVAKRQWASELRGNKRG